MGIVFTMLLIVPLLAILIGVVVLFVLKPRASLQKIGQQLSRPLLQTPLRYGGLIFLFNAAVFGAALLVFFGVVTLAAAFDLPAPMVLFAPLAVAVSGLGWILFGRSWQGTAGGRVFAALIGSAFYWMLFAYGYYELQQLKAHPENSMSDVAFLLLQFISFVAAITCLLMAGWPRNGKKKRL